MSSDSEGAIQFEGDIQTLERIGVLLGRIPSGVFIVAFSDGQGRETAMLASWVQQASFEPPQVTLAVNRDRWFTEWLQVNSPVTISLVASPQKDFLKKFGRGFGPDEPAFEGVEISRGANGLPRLMDSLGTLEGRIIQRIPTGDHDLLIVKIESATSGHQLESGMPMVHLRKNGYRY